MIWVEVRISTHNRVASSIIGLTIFGAFAALIFVPGKLSKTVWVGTFVSVACTLFVSFVYHDYHIFLVTLANARVFTF
jgi:hypothetical protein